MGNEQTKKSGGFLGLFRRKKQSPAEAAQDTGEQTAVAVSPPSYWSKAFKYDDLRKKMYGFVQDDETHKKRGRYEELKRMKEDYDRGYEEAMAVNVPAEVMSKDGGKLTKHKEYMAKSKQDADSMAEAMSRKEKYMAAHEALEKRNGTVILRVAKHADEVKKDDKIVNGSPTTLEGLAEKFVVGSKINAKKREYKKQKKIDDKMEKAGFANTILQYIGSIASSISDGIGTLSDMGVDAKESVEKLKSGKDTWKDAAGWDKTASDTKQAGTGLSWGAAILAFLSMVYSAVELGRACAAAFKRSREKKVDMQERWADARLVLGKICDTFSNAIGAVAPFTAGVPFLGTSLSIADSGLQMLVGTMNLATNSSHSVMMRHDKKEIWKKIVQKRKKYESQGNMEDASFFDVGTNWLGMETQNDDRIDKKRRQLLEIVAANEEIDLQKKTSDNKGKSEQSRNFNEYRGAEAHISSKISELRQQHKEGTDILDKKSKKNSYKRRMHAMEALELMAQYRTAEKSGKKMHKAVGHDVEGLITNGVKLGANITKLVGEVTAVTGYGASLIAAGTIAGIAEGGYEMAREGVAKGYGHFREKYGSNANKENTRSEMAEYLYDKLCLVGALVGDDGNVKLDGMKDYKVRETSDSVEELYSIIRRGLDARVSVLLSTPTPKDMKKALAVSFSQDGGVSFAGDGL